VTARKRRRVVREVMWWAWDGLGLGHLRLAVRDSGVVADGVVLGVEDGRPFRLAYEVHPLQFTVPQQSEFTPGTPGRVVTTRSTGGKRRTYQRLESCSLEPTDSGTRRILSYTKGVYSSSRNCSAMSS
jgi:hypothetical protein